MVCTPPPRMKNEIASVNPLCAFALVIASRNEPGPLSFVFVTISANGTGVGVDGKVSTGGVLLPVFEDVEATVITTCEVTTGQDGESIGQNGWMPSLPAPPRGIRTSLSHALSVSLMRSPGATSTVALVGDGSSGLGNVPGARSAVVRLTLNRI